MQFSRVKHFSAYLALKKNTLTSILARGFAYLLSFFSQVLDFIYWTILIFISIYFDLRDTQKQQLYYLQ